MGMPEYGYSGKTKLEVEEPAVHAVELKLSEDMDHLHMQHCKVFQSVQDGLALYAPEHGKAEQRPIEVVHQRCQTNHPGRCWIPDRYIYSFC